MLPGSRVSSRSPSSALVRAREGGKRRRWSLAQPGIADDAALTRGLHFMIFAIGGPGTTVPLGLLVAGISVPALVMGLLPRWLAVSGLALAAIGALSAVSLVVPGALFLIPLTRFPGFVWLIVAGFLLPRARRGEGQPAGLTERRPADRGLQGGAGDLSPTPG